MPEPTNDVDRQRALELIRRYGWNTTSFQTLEPHLDYWFDPDGPGMVAFHRTAGIRIAVGAPVSPPERTRDCALAFVEAASAAGDRVCFFGLFDRLVEQLDGEGRAVKIGEQPWWNPQLWNDRRDRRRSIGSQVRRAQRSGVQVRQLDPLVMEHPDSPSRRAAESVMDAWLRSHRMASMSFMVHLDPFSFPQQRRYFLAEQRADGVSEEEPVGFLALVPVYARNGWFMEDLVRRPDAPNGTAEMLVDAAMRSVAVEGADYATLGLSSLHGVEEERQAWWIRWSFAVAKRYLGALYNFEGLAAFKGKFRPDGWEDVYLVGVPRLTPRMLLAVLLAFTRSRPVQFAGTTLRRLLVRRVRRVKPSTWQWISFGFAATLVVWITILSQADSTYWFGEAAMRDIWIAFDCVMVAVFILLGRGSVLQQPYVYPVALVAAGAVATDLFLTTAHAIAFHALQHEEAIESILWLMALSGPGLALIFLVGLSIASAAWRHR